MKKCFMTLIVTCLLILATGFSAFAAEPGQGVIHILNLLDGSFYGEATFQVYRAAGMKDGKLSWLDDYAGYKLSLDTNNEKKMLALPQTLSQYVKRDSLKPYASMKTGTDGKCDFTKLPDGMYLVTGDDVIKDGKTIKVLPAVVLIDSTSREATLEAKHTVHKDTEKTSVHVIKSWDDKGNENSRPSSVTVQLLKDGAIKETIKLNKSNNWRHTWTELEGFGWYVAEVDPGNGYTMDIMQDGNTFVVTNHKDSPKTVQTPEKPAEKLPQTGQLWLPVFVLAILAVVFVAAGRMAGPKISAALILAGALCLGIAAGITAYNMRENEAAGETARDAMEAVQAAISDNRESNGAAGIMETPDYKAAEESGSFPMPEAEYNGERYIGEIEIDSLDISLPVISFCNATNLKTAPGRYTGSIYDDDCIIAGHNYKAHFGRLRNLKGGEEVVFTDIDGNRFTYKVKTAEIIDGKDIEGMKSGDWDLTLFTCTPGGLQRRAVRCIRIKEE